MQTNNQNKLENNIKVSLIIIIIIILKDPGSRFCPFLAALAHNLII